MCWFYTCDFSNHECCHRRRIFIHYTLFMNCIFTSVFKVCLCCCRRMIPSKPNKTPKVNLFFNFQLYAKNMIFNMLHFITVSANCLEIQLCQRNVPHSALLLKCCAIECKGFMKKCLNMLDASIILSTNLNKENRI